MALSKRTGKNKRNLERWGEDANKAVSYEMEFEGIVIRPGQKFRLKNDRTVYVFTCLVHNMQTSTSWVECLSESGFYSFRPEKIFRLVGIKRSYKKKQPK